MKTVVIVPVYNEKKIFIEWLSSLFPVLQEMGAELIIIDDGSIPKVQVSGDRFQGQRMHILRHPVNCGVGAALQTGLEYARSLGAKMVFTIDGDGQHNARDLLVLYKKIVQKEADVINGSRFLKQQSIPLFRRWANRCANVVTFLLSGFWVSDSQSGMKAFSQRALAEMNLYSTGYEWCIDVFRIASEKGLTIKEVPVSVLYNTYSLNKGQNFALGLDMLFRLMIRSLTRSHS